MRLKSKTRTGTSNFGIRDETLKDLVGYVRLNKSEEVHLTGHQTQIVIVELRIETSKFDWKPFVKGIIHHGILPENTKKTFGEYCQMRNSENDKSLADVPSHPTMANAIYSQPTSSRFRDTRMQFARHSIVA